MCLAPIENMVKWKINYTLSVKSPTSVVKPMRPSFYLQMNSRTHRQRERESPRTRRPITLLSHTHTNLISAPTHAPPSTPHIVRRQAPTTQPSQGQPRSCCPLCPDHAAPPRSHHDCTGSFAPRSHPLNLTAMLHRCMCLIHHCHHHPRHHPTYPPP